MAFEIHRCPGVLACSYRPLVSTLGMASFAIFMSSFIFLYHLSKSRKANMGSEDMVQQLKVPVGPTVDLNLALSTQVGWLKTACYYEGI